MTDMELAKQFLESAKARVEAYQKIVKDNETEVPEDDIDKRLNEYKLHLVIQDIEDALGLISEIKIESVCESCMIRR